MIKKNTIVAFAAGMATVMCATVAAQQFGGLMFPDVLPNDYFFDSVTRFAKKGIVNGYNNGSFSPHDYVTRGQVTVIVDRYDQQVVRKMRDQIELMRNQLGLGSCGDGEVQVGEDCDDENLLSGDGCSAECLEEIHCAGGYKIGDRYPAPDGCNTCTCTESGIACTERSCTLKKCFTSGECAQSEICSVEEGDCRYPCPVGAVCIQACAGVCIPKSASVVCGNGVCEDGESAVPDRTGSSLYCPQDCSISGPVCGDAICDSGEADEYRLGDEGPILIRRGICAKDCEGGLTACEQKKKSIDVLFAKNIACDTDDDCTVFARGCSPYQTCGKPILKSSLLQVSAAVFGYVDDCKSQEPALCAGCLPNKTACINSLCEVIEDVQN